MEGHELPLTPGEVLAGKYRVQRVLGMGGMGIVLCAEHLQLHQRVAIKLVRPGVIDGPVTAERFLREARAVVNLRSEHIARVFDVGTLESGAPYMVMEYLEGADLGNVLAREGPLSVDTVATYVIQACEAIAEAHAAGVIHRDLKPANLFLTTRVDGTPLVKVLDFGVSKVITKRGTRGLTRSAAVMGSPLYMAPEQMHSARDATGRSDIWALGVVMYELLTQQFPFDAESLPELCLKVVSAAPVPPHVRRADIPPAIEAVILRCLEKDPQRRFDDVGELALALAPFAPPRARETATRARLIVTGMRPMEPTGGKPMSHALRAASDGGVSSTRPPVPRTSRKGLVALGVGALVLAGAGVLVLLTRDGFQPGAPATTSSATIETATAPATSAPAPDTPASAVTAPAPVPAPPPAASSASRAAAPPARRIAPPPASSRSRADTSPDDDIPSMR